MLGLSLWHCADCMALPHGSGHSGLAYHCHCGLCAMPWQGGTEHFRNMVHVSMTQGKWFGAQSANSNQTSNLEVPKLLLGLRCQSRLLCHFHISTFVMFPSKTERLFKS